MVANSNAAVKASHTGAQDLPPILPPSWPRPVAKTAFQGLAGQLVRTIEPHSEADPVALLAQTLAAFGSCIGRKAHFQVEADYHYGNLFICLVGDTAKGRKGVSWGHVRRVLVNADPQWEYCVKTGLSSGEGILHAVRDAQGKDDGVDDKRLLAIEPERATIFKHAERQGNVLTSQLRQCWDSPDICQTLTRNNPVQATAAHVSLVGHITSEELRRHLTATEQANGFANRFLWLAVRRSKQLPEGGNLTGDDLDQLTGQFHRAITFARQPTIVRFDPQASALWYEVYTDLSEGRPGLTGAVLGRAEAQVRRLATLYALLDSTDLCRVEHLEAAITLWNYSERSVRFLFGDATGNTIADTILAALRAAGEDGLSRTDINGLFKGHREAIDIARALGVLLQAKLAYCRTFPTSGRAAERWYSEPDT